MRTFSKPKILISRCLEFDACRYDGKLVTNSIIRKFKKYMDFVTVCPEVDSSMPVPRDKILLIESKNNQKLLQLSTNIDFTRKITDFTQNYLAHLDDIDGIILKSRSPSCGIRDTKIFKNSRSEKYIKKSSGLFAKNVIEQNGHLPIEDENRLTKNKYREHFLTKLYTLSEFKKINELCSLKALEKYHSQNRLLFICYSSRYSNQLNKIIALSNSLNIVEIFSVYEKFLHLLFSKLPRNKAKIDILKKQFKPDQLKYQTYFEPYPEELKKL